MEGLTAKTCKVEAYIVKDDKSNTITIYTGHACGPVISASNIDEAKAKFENALNFAHAVRNLNFYAAAVKASDAEKPELTKKLSKNKQALEIVYNLAA
jgi:hypothetical protein